MSIRNTDNTYTKNQPVLVGSSIAVESSPVDIVLKDIDDSLNSLELIYNKLVDKLNPYCAEDAVASAIAKNCALNYTSKHLNSLMNIDSQVRNKVDQITYLLAQLEI